MRPPFKRGPQRKESKTNAPSSSDPTTRVPRSKRPVALAIAALALAVSAPLLHRLVANDLAAERVLGELLSELPPKTQVLKVKTDVDSADSTCRLLAAKVLATELRPREIVRHLTVPDGDRRELWMAWAIPGRFVASRVISGRLGADEPPPPAVEKLLSQWMIVPDGVRRVVVYGTRPAKSLGEARCWW